jgi:predicted permease
LGFLLSSKFQKKGEAGGARIMYVLRKRGKLGCVIFFISFYCAPQGIVSLRRALLVPVM